MHRFFWIVGAILWVVSCNENLIYSEYASLKNGVWKKGDTIHFQFKSMDTLANHHIFLNIRNDERYEFSNLFLFLEMESPVGNIEVDTLEYEMALPTGEWLGKGMWSVKENKLWYKESMRFRDSGVYQIKLLHAMRKNGEVEGLKNLVGITDVGIQIEKADSDGKKIDSKE